jgi:hypothetical protein
MLVHPLCCNDDRAGEIGPTFHFMTRHDLVLANDRAASEVAAATEYCWLSSGSCPIFRISEHAGTSKHLQTARVCSAYSLDLDPDPTFEVVLTIYVLAVSEMLTAFSLHRRLAWKGK